MFVLSSMQPDAARRKKGHSKPDRVFGQSLGLCGGAGLYRLQIRVLALVCAAKRGLNNDFLTGSSVLVTMKKQVLFLN